MKRLFAFGAFTILGALAGFWAGRETTVRAASNHVFEFRTYPAEPGKLDALAGRFRDHTMRLFKKHGMESVGYFIPQDAPGHANTLMYILEFPSREAAKKSWDEFRADPEWQKVQKESEANGLLVKRENIVSVFADPTPFSPLK
jgi:hypothetical protein